MAGPKLLIAREEIRRKVRELAEALSRDYEGKRPLMIGVLTGAFVFLADLVREMRIPLEVAFVKVESYGDGTVSSGEPRMVLDFPYSVEGREVVIVEDIVDTGHTARFLVEHFKERGAASVKVCTLLNKPARREVEVRLDYVGFDIPNVFVVGYGLDAAGRWRELPDVRYIEEE